jgi:hypothetical protein
MLREKNYLERGVKTARLNGYQGESVNNIRVIEEMQDSTPSLPKETLFI